MEIEKTKLEVVYLPIDDLKPYEKNARKHKAADIGVIKESIEKFGFDDPIGIWGKKNIIVSGHGRLLAAKELGFKEVPCIRLDHLSDEERKAYALTHNRSAELSEWDFENLEEELKELESDFDLESLGFKDFLDEGEPVEVEDDDFDEDAFIPENPESKSGDVYILGEHKLVCGDSTLKSTFDLLLDKDVDLVLTDPPYNVDYEGKTSEALTIKNDKMSDNEFYDFLYKAFCNMYRVAKPGANIFVFHRDIETNFQIAFKDVGFKLAQMWIWEKNSIVMGRGWAHYQHEPIIVGWKEGAPHHMSGDRSLSTILKFDRPTRSLEHPTMKPLDLIGYLINEGSEEGALVLDPFGGSGSTLIACEQVGRKCRTVEIDPKYTDVIVKRYLRYKGTQEGCYLIRNGEKQPIPQEFLSVLDTVSDD